MSVADLAKALTGAIGANSEDEEIKGWLDLGYPPLSEMLTGNPSRTFPYGRIIECFGASGTGKTRLALETMKAAQTAGGIAGFSDHERAWNTDYARKQGLNIEFPHFIYKQPETWEESNMIACKTVETVRKGGHIPDEAPIVWVFDSVAAMIPKSVFEKGIDEYSMNDTTALARVTSTTLKAVNHFVAKYNAIFLYLNQVRTKPGVVYGDPTTTPGGVAMEFYASMRLGLGRKLVRDEDKEVTGQIVGLTSKKNRWARPFQETDLLLNFPDTGGSEFDYSFSIVQQLIAKGKIAYAKPRLTWTDGKQYFIKAFVEKVKAENLYPELVALYKS
jgi:recombination protein RecA